MWLFVIFVLVPLIEIALFIQVGGWLTLWPTLAIVVATAVAGTALVRRQGLQVLGQAQRALDELGDPLAPLAHGAMILFAGALLLTPGFLTDAVGFALLVPAVRVALLRWIIRNRLHVHVMGARPRRPGPGGHPGGGPRPGEKDHRAMRQRRQRIAQLIQRLLRAVQHLKALPAHQRGARHRRRHHDRQRRPQRQPAAHLDEQRDLDQRHEHEDHQQPHGPPFRFPRGAASSRIRWTRPHIRLTYGRRL